MALAKAITLYTVWNATGAILNDGQIKNRITDRFQGHIFDICHNYLFVTAPRYMGDATCHLTGQVSQGLRNTHQSAMGFMYMQQRGTTD